MKEIRDIKIDLVMGNQNPIIDLFCEITSGIEIINCNVYNEEGLEFIYHKDGQWIFYQDSKNEKFWTHYYKYWELFESNFGLKYKEIQAITKYLVEETLKREVSPPFTLNLAYSYKVEETLKREVSPPTALLGPTGLKVEETLKREVSPPSRHPGVTNSNIEDALKREVGTPHEIRRSDKKAVEDALKRELEK